MIDPFSRVGARIGQYELQEFIQRGGMADVYLGQDVMLRRPAAIKILRDDLPQEDEMQARFQREAESLARLQHPNIVQIFTTAVTDDNQPYIAMQYIGGGTLRRRLDDLHNRGEALSTIVALALARQVADALNTIHQAGLVHRDLKPDNILMRTETEPVLADLGLAFMEDSPRLTQTGTVMGTPHYLSPEQINSAKVDGRADIYALGVLLFELLAGRPPFTADVPWDVFGMHLEETPPPITDFRTGLAAETKAVIDRCLQKNPADRFPTAFALVQALDRALLAEGGQAYVSPSGTWRLASTEPGLTPPPAPTIEPGGGNGRTHLWILGVVGVLLLLGGGGLLWRAFAPGSAAVTPTALAAVAAPTDTALPSPTPTATTFIVPTSTLAPIPTVTPTPTVTPLPTATATPQRNRGPETIGIGESVLGEPITAVRLGDGPRKLILIGGIHAGTAPGTVALAEETIAYFSENLDKVPDNMTLYVIANANPDSEGDAGAVNGRFNARGVDLNRNWGCEWVPDPIIRGAVYPGGGGEEAFSEPEVVALARFITTQQPDGVIFWQAVAAEGLSSPGGCNNEVLVSWELAQTYGQAADYVVSDYEGLTNQQVNGDGTNYLDSQGIPAIAVLLTTYEDPEWDRNFPAIQAVLQALSQ